MLSIVKYRRKARLLEEVIPYEDDRIKEAQAERTRLEVEAAKTNGDLEVVLFGSKDLDTLKTTHSRYFESLDDMRRNFRQALNLEALRAS